MRETGLNCKTRSLALSDSVFVLLASAPEEVLGTREGVAAFAEWAPATGLFHRRYRNFGTAEEGEEDGA